MAQIIKHRRGTLAELNGVTLNNGELGIVTSSVASIGDAVLKTAVVVGNTDGTNRLSIGRIIKGNATPNLSGITGGSAFNDMLYHETDAKTLKVLNTGGNTSLDLTGNIADGEIDGTLDITGRVDAQARLDVTGSLNTSGNTVLGDASGDSLTINAATINPANIAAGTDNTVVVYNGSTLVTDEIDSKVWAGNLVDTDGSGANNELVTWSDSDSIIGEGNLTFDGSTLTVTGNAVVTSHISSSANITGSAIYASSGFYGDGSNLTGVAQDIDTLSSYGAATIHQTDDEFLISDSGTEKKITFSNLEDSIFANVSGDATVAAGGALTIAATSVEGSMLNDNVISGQGALGSAAMAQADLLLMDDGPGTLKSVTFSNFEDSIFANVSGDAAIAAGGALTIAATSVEGSMLNDNVISGQGALGGASVAQTDLFMMDDGPGTLKKVTFSNLEDSIFGNVSGDATIAAGGALTIAATSVENSMLADDAVNSDEIASGAVDDDHLSDGVATGLAGAGTTATSGVINVIGGDGITANADDVAVTAAQTTITSVYNTSLKVGRAASQEYVDFSTDNEVNTKVNNTERLSVTSAGADVTGVLTVSSNATISGDLTVNGTTTTISSSTLDIGDNIVQLNAAGTRFGGMHVLDINATETGSFVWDSNNDFWSAGQSGSEYRVPIQDSTTALTNNRVVLAQGNGRIESSANITDDGSTVDFNDVDLTSLDKLEGVDANTYVDIGGSGLIVTKGTIQPATNGGNDLGATGTRYANLWLSANADLEGDIDVNGTANLDNTDIDGTLDVAGVADFQSVVDAQASLTVTGSVYVSAGASVTAASASLVSFRNDSTTQLGYLASADTQAITTGLVGYNTSTGNLTISSVIDGGSF
jgi:hypothetical protein